MSAYAWEFLAPDKLPHPSIRVDNSSVKCDTTMDDLHDLFKYDTHTHTCRHTHACAAI